MESNKKYVIGLDFGTDSCRALVVDTYTGREMATGVSFYPRWKAGLYCDAHNNRYRQHPLDYIESMIEAVHIALSDLKEEEIASICGLCFDTTGSTPARANGIDYVHYFNMRNWTGWITNYSGIYKSVDNGLTWAKCKDITFSSYSFFGQVGYFKKDGYVYMIGTQTGRDSNAKLARFHETDIENKTAYEYWNSFTNQWIKGNENEATVLIEDKVGELSFIYNETHKKWIIAYFNADRYNITMRTAEDITGPWSEPYELANGREYAQLYGSYIHPLSVTGDNLYFTMSMWMPYNVFLMKAELADMGEF